VLKMTLSKIYRKVQYRCFYRIQPQAAVMTSLAMECWYLAIGGSYLIARIGQLLFGAAFYGKCRPASVTRLVAGGINDLPFCGICCSFTTFALVGRIDVPFLSGDVKVMGYQFDYAPIYYTKDLLVHEAHRHPYLERLAQMYLMKLRNEKSFICDAGAVWRQLAVMVLFPWMIKYRVHDKDRQAEAMAELRREEIYRRHRNQLRLAKRFTEFDPRSLRSDSLSTGDDEFEKATRLAARENWGSAYRRSSVHGGKMAEALTHSDVFEDCDSDEFADASM